MTRPTARVAVAVLAAVGLLAVPVGAPAPAQAGPPAGVRAEQTQILSVGGAGPFRIDASLTTLSAAGLIDSTAPGGCDDVVIAGVTGSWAGKILLTFRAGRLVAIGTATNPPHSPAGAGVGDSFADLAQTYGTRGALISNDAGTATAYLVRYGPRVELFTGHPIRPGVGYFQVGPASFVERSFRQGTPC
ncbi:MULTISPECIES: hypothetical protein [Micromonospora]|uniref:Uncharacterized protein n=1 Tax=Micromonospora yangpuensis TaxID=683228 RepID=A0A1C6UHV2_9ACTN|nr:hypothetical protein [Micromonospora yangpuensis]GGM03580.1 hypothetical protein GCM10012279_21630 [Micromonospora yangpuensis]SCL53646.1 hypothetical protein GA0070617_2428 [Micromonospora yangpuensis]